MTFDFNNKNVLITGGSRGIGKATAQLFADAGANVSITFRYGETEASQVLKLLGNGSHMSYHLDLTNPEAVEDFFVRYQKDWGSVDILINNAGIFKEHKILESSYTHWLDSWKETLDTNLTGAANMCFFASKIMVSQGSGKIVNVSSRGAFRGEPDCPAYGASKAGLNAMSQSLAIALAPHNISVHLVAPGFVETEMASTVLNGSRGDEIRAQSPFGRVARPEEVARLVAVYASEGMQFTSGGIADINGASYLRS
ncbi:SDR family NAD(P)-dependent oxidoreductase [Pedobacter duraquae]|uniref:NAD(P)-dependent dehydrogenase (Short-subunit alcohol dehydrogenase family) n=1 Tax=Pedobacter duraquae TaxID=425511 RepID=A0A4R6IF80_9SPHI|nr:SDR family oxidoreductase [Pedobacter duraquae]TDO20722.1 NAD(P)-dependent dehydrogenase (short-subunit alcohol dehydrogenase family) [Pedobacter duraquae]